MGQKSGAGIGAQYQEYRPEKKEKDNEEHQRQQISHERGFCDERAEKELAQRRIKEPEKNNVRQQKRAGDSFNF